MDNSHLFLLKKIAGYKENGLTSLGQLHAQHFEDITKVMDEFFEASLKEFIKLANTGKSVDVGFASIQLRGPKSRKKSKV